MSVKMAKLWVHEIVNNRVDHGMSHGAPIKPQEDVMDVCQGAYVWEMIGI